MSTDPKRELLEALRTSLGDGSFVGVALGKYRGPAGGARRVSVRRVVLQGAERLSFRFRYDTRDDTQNLELAEAYVRLEELAGADYRSVVLRTTGGDLHLELNRRREARLRREKAATTEAPDPRHDRVRHRLLGPEAVRYLAPLGVMTESGQVRERMAHKYRQIEKFTEILQSVISASPAGGPLRVYDMGAGKGYLTFAAYDWLHHARGYDVTLTAVEARPELVAEGNALAHRIGMGGLRFVVGSIADTPVESADLLIALHACDTATDDALFQGIAAGCAVILCAPCCHKEIRAQLQAPAGLERALRHGILQERQAEIVTDSLRALLLERSGYAAKVFEFISTEHTSKNLMIAATKREAPPDRAAVERTVEALKATYGIREQRLERLLAETEVPKRGGT
jgi:SAM-dependent methyltransferase